MIRTYRHSFTISFDVVPDRFYGPVLRGGIGSHLKRLLSSQEYDEAFNTPSDGTIMKKYPEVPKGYVVDVPFENDANVDFSLILFDKTEKYFDAFQQAIVKTIGKNGAAIAYKDMVVSEWKSANTPGNLITISYETPACIKYKGKTWQKPELHILIRNILRREFLLGHYYSLNATEIDKSIIDVAERVSLVHHNCILAGLTRYSTRKEQQMKMEGLIGGATYSLPTDLIMDEKKKLLESLKSGESFHVGKNTTFGFGKLKIMS